MIDNLIFEINITINEVKEVIGAKGTVRMVSFGGNVSSPLFNGEVIPDAVDTQIQYNTAAKKLSARYILEGKDIAGNHCRIFIENNGTENNDVIITTPVIITDSHQLQWLENAVLKGTIVSENNQLVVKIYEENVK